MLPFVWSYTLNGAMQNARLLYAILSLRMWNSFSRFLMQSFGHCFDSWLQRALLLSVFYVHVQIFEGNEIINSNTKSNGNCSIFFFFLLLFLLFVGSVRRLDMEYGKVLHWRKENNIEYNDKSPCVCPPLCIKINTIFYRSNDNKYYFIFGFPSTAIAHFYSEI